MKLVLTALVRAEIQISLVSPAARTCGVQAARPEAANARSRVRQTAKQRLELKPERLERLNIGILSSPVLTETFPFPFSYLGLPGRPRQPSAVETAMDAGGPSLTARKCQGS